MGFTAWLWSPVAGTTMAEHYLFAESAALPSSQAAQLEAQAADKWCILVMSTSAYLHTGMRVWLLCSQGLHLPGEGRHRLSRVFYVCLAFSLLPNACWTALQCMYMALCRTGNGWIGSGHSY